MTWAAGRARPTTGLRLLKAHGIVGLLHKRDWPKFVDPMRPIYEPEELKALFAACTEGERVLFLFYLLTGMRDKKCVIAPGAMLTFAVAWCG